MSKKESLLRHLYRNKLPRLIQDKIDVLRGESQVFRPCFEDTKSIFIHIPKAAGTSIAHAIYGMNVGHRKASDYIAVSKSEFNKYYRFSFARNPWDRIVSAFNFVKQGGTSYVQPLPNVVYKSEAFKSFDHFVHHWLPYADLSMEDVVFAPQYEYIYDDLGCLLVDFVGKIETLGNDIKYISETLNIKIFLENMNQSSRKNRDYRSYYTDSAIGIVAEIYKTDVELFDYEF